MEIVKLTKENYQDWDKFCLESGEAWFWHTSGWLEYHLNYRPEIKPRSLSFFLKENNKLIAACPLILETINGQEEFSYGGGYGPAPIFAGGLAPKQMEKIKKNIFERIDALAKENKVKRARLRFSVLDKSGLENENQQYNYLMKYGFIDTSLNTQILDLRKPLGELRRAVRHGHDAAISRAEKILTAEIFDGKNITSEIFQNYAELHHLASGRITRPVKTFDLMLEFIKTGQAFLVSAKKQDVFIGFSYFFAYKKNVYYGSACNDPAYKDIPIAHFIQWRAIEYLKEKKYDFYEIGWQYFNRTLADNPSQKEIDISSFKRGFGGQIVPLFRGEKYYDKDYFLTVYSERLKNYAGNL